MVTVGLLANRSGPGNRSDVIKMRPTDKMNKLAELNGDTIEQRLKEPDLDLHQKFLAI